MNSCMYARLDGHQVVPCEITDLTRSFDIKDRRVAETQIGRVWVSAVFLGINHQWDDSAPSLWFETMAFYGGEELTQLRYTTWRQAELGHASVVEHYSPLRVRFLLWRQRRVR